MIRVLIVEDSATSRLLLTELLSSDRDIQVVGTANDGQEAVALALELRPDVITMDIHMPRMDGLEATRRIMEQVPTPIVVVSASADPAGLPFTFNAIQAGALDVLEKPSGFAGPNFALLCERLVTTVKLMAEVKVVRRRTRPQTNTLAAGGRSLERPNAHTAEPRSATKPDGTRSTTSHSSPRSPQADGSATGNLIPASLTGTLRRCAQPVALLVLGASTGGPAALAAVLKGLPRDFALPVLVVQHIASGFLPGLVSWLQNASPLPLNVAVDGEAIMSGQVYFAPEDRHLVVAARGMLGASASAPVNHVRPSATVLFKSAAQAYGCEAAGVLLTGMGEDGAAGLKAIHDAGGPTLAQDEATSVVYGMPKAAADLGAVDHVLPLERIAAAMIGMARKRE